jgi:hypothetical protein
MFDFFSNSNYGGGTSNGGYSSVPSYSAANVQTSYPAAANPFLDDNDNVDSLSPSHQSPISTGDSAGAPVRALYDYDAQEQDELTFKQGRLIIDYFL